MNHELTPNASPYFGLQPATEQEAQYFFGRENEQRIIKTNMYGQPLTVLYGPSGVGKSSLLLAAVAPQLHRPKQDRPKQAVVVFRQYEEKDIAGGLKRAVLETVEQVAPNAPKIDTSLPLDEFLIQCNRATRGPIFLVFDQFESYFLRNPSSPDTDAFEAQFARAINRQDIDVHVLLALREDRLSNLDRFQARINAFQNLLRVEALTREAAAKAIREPLRKYNESQSPNGAVRIEDGLVEALLDDVSNVPAAGAGRVDTPSLQLALLSLWEEERKFGSTVLRLSTYERLGRAERIVGNHLEQIMQGFEEPDRRLAAHMFRYLVTPAGVKVAHTAEDLVKYINDEARVEGAVAGRAVRVEDAKRILDELCNPDVPSDRILQPVAPLTGQPDDVRYEIFHDVLGPAVLKWQSSFRETEIRAAEKKRAAVQRLRWTMAVMAVALVLLSGATILALNARREAVRQSGIAERQRVEADRQRKDAVESKAKVVEAQVELEKSYADVKDARDQAVQQAAEAEEARRQAEQLKNIANEARNRAVTAQRSEAAAAASARQSALAAMAARKTAEEKQQEAEKARQEAEAAKDLAELKRQEAEAARADADEKLKRALEAEAAERLAKAATTESIELIRKIDASAPFFGGVVRNPEPLMNAAFSPDINTIVTSNSAGNVLYWKTGAVRNLPQDQLTTTNSQAKVEVPTPSGTPLITALSADGQLAATADSGTVYVWTPQPASKGANALRQRPRFRLVGPNGAAIKSVAVTSFREKRFVAAGYANGAVAVWNLDTCEGPGGGCPSVVNLTAHGEGVNTVAFSHDGRFLATGSGRGPTRPKEVADCRTVSSQDNDAKVWEVAWPTAGGGGSLTYIKTLSGHRCRVNSVAFNHPDSSKSDYLRVVTASDDGTARAWNILRIKEVDDTGAIRKWKKVRSSVYTLDVYAAPRVAFPLFRQPIRKFFNISFRINELTKQQLPIYAAAYSPVDDNIIVTSGDEGALRVWDVESSSTVRIIQGHYGSVRNVAFSPGGKYLVSASEDNTVRLWSICQPGGADNVIRSIIANLTTKKAGDRLNKDYCGAVNDEQLP